MRGTYKVREGGLLPLPAAAKNGENTNGQKEENYRLRQEERKSCRRSFSQKKNVAPVKEEGTEKLNIGGAWGV